MPKIKDRKPISERRKMLETLATMTVARALEPDKKSAEPVPTSVGAAAAPPPPENLSPQKPPTREKTDSGGSRRRAPSPNNDEMRRRHMEFVAYWNAQPAQLPHLKSLEANLFFKRFGLKLRETDLPNVGVPGKIDAHELDDVPASFPFALDSVQAEAAMEAYMNQSRFFRR